MYLLTLAQSTDEQNIACPEFDPAALPGIDQLPLGASPMPTPLPFPEVSLSQAWIGEISFLLIPALVFLTWFLLIGRDRTSTW